MSDTPRMTPTVRLWYADVKAYIDAHPQDSLRTIALAVGTNFHVARNVKRCILAGLTPANTPDVDAPPPPPPTGTRGNLSGGGVHTTDHETSDGQRTISISGTVEAVTARIQSLDDLFALFSVDLSQWEVIESKIGAYEGYRKNKQSDLKWKNGVMDGYVRDYGGMHLVTLFQASARVRRKPAAALDALTQRLIDRFEQAAISAAPPPPLILARAPQSDPAPARLLLELSVKDVHFGKLAYHREVGENYDLRIALANWRAAIDGLLAKVAHLPIDTILSVIGSDGVHVNNSEGTTKSGTPVDHDGRVEKMFDVFVDANIWKIERCLEHAERFIGLFVPGNHGEDIEMMAAKAIKAHFHNDPRVSIDTSPIFRKYTAFGSILLMHTHGHDTPLADLPLLMATEAPDAWAGSRFREIHTDHRHTRIGSRKGGLALATDGDYAESHGVMLRVSAALTGADLWHFRHGFVGNIPGAEAYVWDAETGLYGVFNVNIDTRQRQLKVLDAAA